MSDSSSQPRPVSPVALAAIVLGLALFLVLVKITYLSHRDVPAQNLSAESVPSAMAWESTPAGRSAYLASLRAKQEKQAASYGWVDEKAGVVQLPIDRAMELIAQEYNPKK